MDRMAGMVFQRPNPFPTMSIYDNVIAGYKLNGIGMKRSQRDEIVERSLRDVTLWDEVKDSLVKKGTFLSGGQQQRVAIARAVVARPEFLIADEPTGNLDPALSAEIMTLFEAFNQVGVTVLVAPHDASLIARSDHRLMTLAAGQLMQAGVA